MAAARWQVIREAKMGSRHIEHFECSVEGGQCRSEHLYSGEGVAIDQRMADYPCMCGCHSSRENEIGNHIALCWCVGSSAEFGGYEE